MKASEAIALTMQHGNSMRAAEIEGVRMSIRDAARNGKYFTSLSGTILPESIKDELVRDGYTVSYGSYVSEGSRIYESTISWRLE